MTLYNVNYIIELRVRLSAKLLGIKLRSIYSKRAKCHLYNLTHLKQETQVIILTRQQFILFAV